MSVAFYTDDRNISPPELHGNSLLNIDNFYEVEKCVEWINRNNFAKVALQFPDALLRDAATVAVKIEDETNKEIFILGDTSYGSCCVDEIAASHVRAEAIIHFGHACLSLTHRYPVMYVFGCNPIDVQNYTSEFRRLFPDLTSPVVIYYEVFYSHAIGQIAENLRDYENLVIAELEIPHTDCKIKVNDNQVKITKCQRHFIIPKTQNISDFSIFYIGLQNRTLTNVMLSLNQCQFYTYNPVTQIAQPETLDVNKYLKRRYYYVEKAKDAKVIGVLVGTLGVSDYLSIIKHVRELLKAAGKKWYTFTVGKVNIAKLANFAEIEIFVSVACIESSVVDCQGFFQPIITPYELEIALNQAREWSGDYITDFAELLPEFFCGYAERRSIAYNWIIAIYYFIKGATKHISPSEIKKIEADLSLITGRLRSFVSNSVEGEEGDGDLSAVVQRDTMAMAHVHSQAAGEFISERSWKGLQQLLGETPVAIIQEGRTGIACEYEEEQNG